MRRNDARKLPQDELEHIRREALSLREQGDTCVRIAEVCGVHVSTCLKWAKVGEASQ